jgi:hypothetical protein
MARRPRPRTPRARRRKGLADPPRRWILYSSGTNERPCGYHPGTKPDGDAITGRHVAEDGFRYESQDRTMLYVAVWVEDENTIPMRRIMKNQLEAGA